MYFALVGRPPFVGDNPLEVMISHARDPVEPLSKFRSDVPKDLEEIVLRCLAKERDARFPSMKALSKALAGCECASEWDSEKADEWWVNAAQSAVHQPADV